MILHPIVAHLNPSSEQAPAIAARDHTIVVTAGAGTGKTSTLVARYLSLLADSPQPENSVRNIVAITFTEKAAREMRNRIRHEVGEYIKTLEGEKRDPWEAVNRALDAARIMTFHGFSAEILRNHPAEAGVDPRFDILDEARANLLKSMAVEQTLAWLANEPAVAPLLTMREERDIEVTKRLKETLTTLLREPSRTEAIFASLPDDMLAYWQAELPRLRTEALARLRQSDAWQNALTLLEEIQPVDSDSEDNKVVAWRHALEAVRDDGTLAAQIARLKPLADINLQRGSGKAWPDADTHKDIKAVLKTLRDTWKKQQGLLLADLNHLDEETAVFLPLLQQAYRHALTLYTGYKTKRNSLDFSDLEAFALKLLQEAPSVRARWQQETHALLVDEFQDTNSAQRDFINLLSGQRNNLFFVGDAKQSIYRFRGADVSVFRDERKRVSAANSFELTTSYRTHDQLLTPLNRFFRQTLGESEDATRPWHEPFAGLTAHHPHSRKKTLAPHIELHLAVGNKADTLGHAASLLVNRLLELVDDPANDLALGDIAILCRTANAFQYYENALSEAHIPYITIAGQGLYERPEIRDLLNMLQAVTTPEDDLALIGLLRSPVFGFSDRDLYTLTQTQAAHPDASLYTLLPNFPHPNSSHILETIRGLNQLAGKISVADLLKRLLSLTDYVAALYLADEARSARNVEKLLHDAHASGTVYVGEFLELIANLREGGARAGEARAAATGVVQLMTIHQSKGLQFPAVVIGDASYSRRVVERPLLLDDALKLLLPLKEDDVEPTMYTWARSFDADKEASENGRLLYVAATRAQDHLLINGVCKLNAKDKFTRLTGWLKEIAAITELDQHTVAGYDAEGADVHHIPLYLDDAPITCKLYEPNVKHQVARPAQTDTLTIVGANDLLAPIQLATPEVEERPQSVWRIVPEKAYKTAPAWIIGTLVHQALAAWYFPDANDNFDRWALSQLRSFGLTADTQLDHALTQTKTLLNRFQQHDLYRELLTADPRLHEVPFALLDDTGQVREGYIDVIYWHNGAWIIVDFKTDRLTKNKTIASVLAKGDYRAQLTRYKEAANAFLGETPRTKLCFLDDMGKVTVQEEV